MGQTGGANDLRIDKKEQAKSLKTIQDYTDVGEYTKAVKYINMSKWSYLGLISSEYRVDEKHQLTVLQSYESSLLN